MPDIQKAPWHDRKTSLTLAIESKLRATCACVDSYEFGEIIRVRIIDRMFRGMKIEERIAAVSLKLQRLTDHKIAWFLFTAEEPLFGSEYVRILDNYAFVAMKAKNDLDDTPLEYWFNVTEVRTYQMHYKVTATSYEEAVRLAENGETDDEEECRLIAVTERIVDEEIDDPNEEEEDT
jgi:hypothetical protein